MDNNGAKILAVEFSTDRLCFGFGHCVSNLKTGEISDKVRKETPESLIQTKRGNSDERMQ